MRGHRDDGSRTVAPTGSCTSRPSAASAATQRSSWVASAPRCGGREPVRSSRPTHPTRSTTATGPGAARSAASTRPRTCRSVPCHGWLRRRWAWASGGQPGAGAAQRARGTPRGAAGADQGAQLHERRDGAGSGRGLVGQQRVGGGRLGRGQVRWGQRLAAGSPRQHPAYVGVEGHRASAEREGPDGRCRVGADPWQAAQRVLVVGHLAVVLLDQDLRRLVQPQGPPRVAEAAPGPQHVGDVRRGQVRRPGPAGRPLAPHRFHPGHGSLLEHHLADQHPPGGPVRRPPRQRTGMRAVPAGQGSPAQGRHEPRGLLLASPGHGARGPASPCWHAEERRDVTRAGRSTAPSSQQSAAGVVRPPRPAEPVGVGWLA